MKVVLFLALIGLCQSRPPVKEKPKGKPAQNETNAEWDVGVEYNRYLQEVVQVLESDPEFRKKLENAEVDHIRDGTIAHELEFVNHGIRTKLDEIKRKELERLRHLAMKQNEIQQGIDRKHMKIPQHLEVRSPRFEIDDLKKLIKTTTLDLEEVWEKQDHMRAEDWNPKTFFAMHDLNGDNFWDEDEIRVLFRKELDKVYDPNEPEDDMKEREEEMERMREHVFKESDTNKDHLISFDEFMTETKRDEFENDPGWDTMDQDEDEEFSDEEFRAFQAQRQGEIKSKEGEKVL